MSKVFSQAKIPASEYPKDFIPAGARVVVSIAATSSNVATPSATLSGG